jgi:tyrosinase
VPLLRLSSLLCSHHYASSLLTPRDPTGAMYLTTLTLLATAASAATCCAKTAVRKEWRTLPTREKSEYISAVKCLLSKPSQLTQAYPGARSRFDDFQAVHINLTEKYHFTGPFQPWHRVFVWQYENDLRELCGYKGGQP